MWTNNFEAALLCWQEKKSWKRPNINRTTMFSKGFAMMNNLSIFLQEWISQTKQNELRGITCSSISTISVSTKKFYFCTKKYLKTDLIKQTVVRPQRSYCRKYTKKLFVSANLRYLVYLAHVISVFAPIVSGSLQAWSDIFQWKNDIKMCELEEQKRHDFKILTRVAVVSEDTSTRYTCGRNQWETKLTQTDGLWLILH